MEEDTTRDSIELKLLDSFLTDWAAYHSGESRRMVLDDELCDVTIKGREILNDRDQIDLDGFEVTAVNAFTGALVWTGVVRQKYGYFGC
jgi:hypothetical protein